MTVTTDDLTDEDAAPIASRSGALVYEDWRIDLVRLDGRPMLRICQGDRRIAYCPDKRSALAVLEQHAVPIDQFTRT
jgi:hypothetical protein